MPVQLSDTPQTDADRSAQATLQSRGEIPAHIACIMDGKKETLAVTVDEDVASTIDIDAL